MKNPQVGDHVEVKKSTQSAYVGLAGKKGAVVGISVLSIWVEFPDTHGKVPFYRKELKRAPLAVGEKVRVGPLPHGVGSTETEVGQTAVVSAPTCRFDSMADVTTVTMDLTGIDYYFETKDLRRVA